MVVPILCYLAITWGSPLRRGFGVPVATDIAFALALLLMVLGDRVPGALKAFLLAFAAVDDVGGVLVIALFYGHGLSLPWLLAAGAVACGAAALFHLRPQNEWTYVAVGLALWITTALSGVHVTIAGVAFGLMVPSRPLFAPEEVAERAKALAADLDGHTVADRPRVLGRLEELAARSESPSARLARVVRPAVGYLVLPVFALAMAGTSVSVAAWSAVGENAAALGIVAGLLVGKPIGVFACTWVGVRLGIAALPPSLRWRHVLGAAALSSIGFTVSLFIAKLAFGPADLAAAKLAILLSSTAGGLAGLAILGAPGGRE